MGEVHDPWKKESLITLPEPLLLADWTSLLPTLSKLNQSGFRLSTAQSDVIYCRYLQERGKPLNRWFETETLLSAMALARHPRALEEIEEVFAIGEFDLTGAACRALLAWHGMPEIFLIWVGEMDHKNFAEFPLSVQDYIRGVDISATWERSGISTYFHDTCSDKIERMAETFHRMDMPSAAAAILEAWTWWEKVKAVHELKLDSDAHWAAFDPLIAKWEEAAWKMSDQTNSLLAGISRYAAKNAHEIRRASGWFEDSPQS